jgi:hypothetical protein
MATKLAKIVADFRTSLATKLSVGGTSATLQSATDDDGVALPSGKYYFTLDGESTQKEYILCDLAGTALTNIKSVSRQGVQTNGAAREHRIGSSAMITDFGHIKYMNDLLDGTTMLNASTPLEYDATATIANNNQLATKAYADALTFAGAPDSSPTQKGLVEQSTTAEYLAGMATGSTGAPLSVSPDILLTYSTVHRNVGAQYGTTLSYGDVLYVDSTSGKYLKAVATDSTLLDKVFAVAYDGGVLNDYGKVHFPGSIIFTGSGLTKGAPVYLSDTATVSATAGTYRKVIGVAVTASAWVFMPSVDTPTATSTASKIPIADSNGKLNSWVDAFQFAMTAGEAINSTSTPIALYQKESDGKVYKLDATSAAEAAYNFIGFAVYGQNVSTDGSINIQVDGVVSNFTGLTVGADYFSTNTAGTISTSAGSKVLKIGHAISATKLKIELGRKVASGTTTFSSTTNTTITIGFKATTIRIHATMAKSSVFSSSSNGGWNVTGGNSCVYVVSSESSTNATAGTGSGWYVQSNNAGTETHAGSVTNITSTTFRLDNTKTNSPGDVNIYWEAIA